jgi:hypothetical protein
MDDKPVELDQRRGMAAQKSTELRRRIAEVAADQAELRARQDELERFLSAAPARDWADAVEVARYLLGLLSASAEAQDTRRQKLISDLISDFDRLLANETRPDPSSRQGD